MNTMIPAAKPLIHGEERAKVNYALQSGILTQGLYFYCNR